VKFFCYLKSLSFVLIFAGCAGVEPTKLKKASTNNFIEISQDYHFDENYKLASMHYFYTLSAGKYLAKYESKSGVYYEGDGTCLEMNGESSSASLQKTLVGYYPKKYKCGIFVANKTLEIPKIYYYRDKEESSVDARKAGVLIKALNDMEIDNIQILRDQPKGDALKGVLNFSK